MFIIFCRNVAAVYWKLHVKYLRCDHVRWAGYRPGSVLHLCGREERRQRAVYCDFNLGKDGKSNHHTADADVLISSEFCIQFPTN